MRVAAAVDTVHVGAFTEVHYGTVGFAVPEDRVHVTPYPLVLLPGGLARDLKEIARVVGFSGLRCMIFAVRVCSKIKRADGNGRGFCSRGGQLGLNRNGPLTNSIG
jgi:hypothetical protein